MIKRQRTQVFRIRYIAFGTLILLLLAAFPLTALAGHRDAMTYSGDDAYDPAAGGFAPSSANFAVTYSGDDAYDLAAGASGFAASSTASLVSYSGDDAYDPAAGGLGAITIFDFAAGQSDAEGCELAGGPIIGIHSGDAAYDPAASRYGLDSC